MGKIVVHYWSSVDQQLAAGLELTLTKTYTNIQLSNKHLSEPITTAALSTALKAGTFGDILITVGAQQANPLFKRLADDGHIREITSADTGKIMIQETTVDGVKIFAIAGWTLQDTENSIFNFEFGAVPRGAYDLTKYGGEIKSSGLSDVKGKIIDKTTGNLLSSEVSLYENGSLVAGGTFKDNYLFTDIPKGLYVLSSVSPGFDTIEYNVDHKPPIDSVIDLTHTPEANVPKKAHITFRIVDDDDTTVLIPSTVTMTLPDGKVIKWTITKKTDVGLYPAGHYTFTISSKGYESYTGSIDTDGVRDVFINRSLHKITVPPTAESDISMNVVRRDTGKSIPALVKMTIPAGDVLEYNILGKTSIGNFPAGNYTLDITSSGFKPQTKSFTHDGVKDTYVWIGLFNETTPPPSKSNIGGELFKAATRIRIEGTVTLLQAGKILEKQSTEQSEYTFIDYPKGEYTIRAEAEGYISQEKTIQHDGKTKPVIDFYLEEEAPPKAVSDILVSITDKDTGEKMGAEIQLLKDGQLISGGSAFAAFKFTDIPAGDYVLTGKTEGRPDLNVMIHHTPPKDSIAALQFELPSVWSALPTLSDDLLSAWKQVSSWLEKWRVKILSEVPEPLKSYIMTIGEAVDYLERTPGALDGMIGGLGEIPDAVKAAKTGLSALEEAKLIEALETRSATLLAAFATKHPRILNTVIHKMEIPALRKLFTSLGETKEGKITWVTLTRIIDDAREEKLAEEVLTIPKWRTGFRKRAVDIIKENKWVDKGGELVERKAAGFTMRYTRRHWKMIVLYATVFEAGILSFMPWMMRQFGIFDPVFKKQLEAAMDSADKALFTYNDLIKVCIHDQLEPTRGLVRDALSKLDDLKAYAMSHPPPTNAAAGFIQYMKTLWGIDIGTVSEPTIEWLDGVKEQLIADAAAKDALFIKNCGETPEEAPPSAKKLGSIAVSTVPDKASIWIDGILQVYPSDTVIQGVEPGEHLVKISKTGYEDAEEKVTVEADKQTDITVTLVKAVPASQKATLTVSSDPVSFAEIWVDGQFTKKMTTSTLILEAGVHSITVKKTDYYDEQQEVDLKAGDVKTLAFTLTKIPPAEEKPNAWKYTISVTDKDTGEALTAKILVNGSFTGKYTPDFILLAPESTYLIRIEKSGYDPYELEVTTDPL